MASIIDSRAPTENVYMFSSLSYSFVTISSSSAAFKRLVEIQKVFPKDRAMKARVLEILKANNNRELSVLIKLDSEADKVLNDSSMKDFVKKSQTKRILNSYNQYIAKVTSTELRKEAEESLAKFQKASE